MQKAKEEKCDEYKSIWLMAIILIVAFANYIVGYNWGLTSTFQPDESKLVEPLVSMVESKTLIHSAWAYPAQVSTKVLAIVLTWVSKFVILQHLQYYFANRIMYAFIGTGCVYITWRIIRKVRDERFALLMISLMAICPILAQYCKEVSGDVPYFSRSWYYCLHRNILWVIRNLLYLWHFLLLVPVLKNGTERGHAFLLLWLFLLITERVLLALLNMGVLH